MTGRRWFPDGVRPPSRAVLVLVAAVVPVAVAGALAGVRDAVPPTSACLVLVAAVVAVAAAGDRAAGLVAAVSCGVWFDYFLTRPFYSLTIRDRDNVEITVLLVLIGAAVSELALWGRRQQERASRREGYLDGVIEVAGLAAVRDLPAEALCARVAEQIRTVLDVTDCHFEPVALLDPRHAVLEPDGTVVWAGHVVDVDRGGLPVMEETTLPVRRGPDLVGQFVIGSVAAAYPTVEQRRVCVLLAEQVVPVLAGLDPGEQRPRW